MASTSNITRTIGLQTLIYKIWSVTKNIKSECKLYEYHLQTKRVLHKPQMTSEGGAASKHQPQTERVLTNTNVRRGNLYGKDSKWQKYKWPHIETQPLTHKTEPHTLLL